jgi:hypothetical protein
MERLSRTPFQGVVNIIRFNWHYYVIASVIIILAAIAQIFFPSSIRIITGIILLMAVLSIIVSLVASWYIYDNSGLYTLNWLDNLNIGSNKQLVNINAGFDETSHLLKEKFPGCNLLVFDFYDPAKHTEISIERARKAYPAYEGTATITTNRIPLQENSADCIFLILAAHEIRDNEERIMFFCQLKKILSVTGKIIVVEHQRDMYNFMAYNFGFFHFFSTNTWKKTFKAAGLTEDKEFKITPFISAFVLTKNGTTA